jgi:hypothetical protein
MISSIYDLAIKYGCDKTKYSKKYSEVFEPIRNKVKTVLEIGVYHGNSLRVWRDYFPNAKICGIDNLSSYANKNEKLNIWSYFTHDELNSFIIGIGDQRDKGFLESFGNTYGLFDIIIDDGNHTRECNSKAFEYIKKYLTVEGIYSIEDVPKTATIKSWLGSTNIEGFEFLGRSTSEKSNDVETLLLFRRQK